MDDGFFFSNSPLWIYLYAPMIFLLWPAKVTDYINFYPHSFNHISYCCMCIHIVYPFFSVVSIKMESPTHTVLALININPTSELFPACIHGGAMEGAESLFESSYRIEREETRGRHGLLVYSSVPDGRFEPHWVGRESQ